MKMPEKAPSIKELYQDLEKKNISFLDIISLSVPDNPYFSYSDIKYKLVPDKIKELGGDRNTWWLALFFARKINRKLLPLVANDGMKFSYSLNDSDLSFLHSFDLNAGGTFETVGLMPSESDKNRYLIASLIEESFSSSFIEGAVSTRDKAKKLIAEKREPKDKSEIMILNNFKTMQSLKSWIGEDLSTELICKIHSSISKNTLDEEKLGNFRGKDDKVVLSDDEGNIYHTPCDYTEIQARIEALCAFINTQNDSADNFIHPIVKAIILHFIFAYIHPFCDGNGRTARALFYWYLIKNKYWIVEYISISNIILESGNRYYKSFLDTEVYNFDLNYFIKFQLEIFDRAVKAFHDYVASKKKKLMDRSERYPILKELNSRQKDLVLKIINKPFESVEETIESYSNINNVAWETARKDLASLLKKEVLAKSKNGKIFVYTPSKAFLDSIAGLG